MVVSSSSVGFIAAAIAPFAFGSNYVPVKYVRTGNGLAFQFFLCIGILTSGLLSQLYFIAFEDKAARLPPLALIGGAMWAVGNLTSVPIIKLIGMGVGLLVWSNTSLIAGWAVAHFGLFGIDREVLARPTLNFIGVIIIALSTTLYVFIKTEVKAVVGDGEAGGGGGGGGGGGVDVAVAGGSSSGGSQQRHSSRPRLRFQQQQQQQQQQNIFDSSPTKINERSALLSAPLAINRDNVVQQPSSPSIMKRILGLLLSVFAGILYGTCLIPVSVLMQRAKAAGEHDVNVLQMVLAHFTGAFFLGFFVLFVYWMLMLSIRGRIEVYAESVVPGIVSGLVWSIGQMAWFVANDHLGYDIAFPIVTSTPGIIANLWAVFLFREIKGFRNLFLLCSAILGTGVGIALVTLSKNK